MSAGPVQGLMLSRHFSPFEGVFIEKGGDEHDTAGEQWLSAFNAGGVFLMEVDQ